MMAETRASLSTSSVALEDNPFYSKYAEKIKQTKREQKEVTSAQEEMSREQIAIKEGLERLEKTLDPEAKSPTTGGEDTERAEAGTGPGSGGGPVHGLGSKKAGFAPKKLGDVVHLDKFKQHSPEEVTQLWKSYHRNKENCLYAVVPGSSYDVIHGMGKEYPLFIFPLPRVDKSGPDGGTGQGRAGYEFIFSQFQGHSFYLTTLLMYQTYHENAPPCLVLNHYPELQQDKGLVLMNGEFDNKIITLLEAQCLANQIKLFYGDNDETTVKRKLIHTFNRQPLEFKHQELINEIESSLVFQPKV
jgi:ATP synthase F1 complex assembly factor 1